MRKFEDFIYPKQKELFEMLKQMYRKRHHINFCKDKYILVQGEAPVLLLAHLDTVHKNPVKQICKSEDKNIWMSPQGIGGDDRCGVYAIVTAHEQSEIKPWLLFTCDEEIGGVGAERFCLSHEKNKLPKALDDVKMLIEIDRKGKDDAVYYDCANYDFEDYITKKGFNTAFGSFSDISVVGPELGAAAVNLSSGYYNAHNLHEYINIRQLKDTIKKVVEIIADAARPDFPKYEYIEDCRHLSGLYGGFGILTDEVPDNLPEEYRYAYAELLDWYSQDELDNLRIEHGDQIIAMMYESEFGMSYKELNEYHAEEEAEEDTHAPKKKENQRRKIV